MVINLPSYSQKLWDPKRYKCLVGGRGSAKSTTVARLLLIKALTTPSKILCGREYQNSIQDSVHSLLHQESNKMNLNHHFKITNHSITTKDEKSEFIFKGLDRSINSIKSIPDITDAWIEEAQTISQRSLDILIPTIRAPNSEIWVTYNPENTDDPIHKLFSEESDDSLIIKANWRDNPWFPEVLKNEKNKMLRTNPDLYHHIWEGECRSSSDAQIFKDKFVVQDFKPHENLDGPYFGVDWGFAVDPTIIIKLWIDSDKNYLLIEYEAGGVGIELPDLEACFEEVPGSKDYLIKADCARPEIIKYMQKNFIIEGCKKWKDCEEEGVIFMKSFDKIIIHPRCQGTLSNFRNYKYKVDPKTDRITSIIVDEYDDRIDACRYALEEYILNNSLGMFSNL